MTTRYKIWIEIEKREEGEEEWEATGEPQPVASELTEEQVAEVLRLIDHIENEWDTNLLQRVMSHIDDLAPDYHPPEEE